MKKINYAIKCGLKYIKKAGIAVIAIELSLSSFNMLKAEDYPAGYLGSGYREYLSGKIQGGYYIETFNRMNRMQKERVDKRNEIEKVVTHSYQATPQTTNTIAATGYEHYYNSENLKTEIAQNRQAREQVASVNLPGGFTYIPYSDGKIVHFKDGLPIRIENERVLDEFGNLSIKNTYNMKYNDKRLLVSLEADLRDHLGNITHTRQYGMQYSGDSLWYATNKTNANKNLLAYILEEIDAAGNVKITQFSGAVYEGKLLRAFHQRIDDSVYGVTEFDRTNITYANNDPEKMSSYHEEGIGTDNLAYSMDRKNINYNEKNQILDYQDTINTTQIDGTVSTTTVDAKFKYLGVANKFGPDIEESDPDKLLESIITTTVTNPDGSTKAETNTTTYEYTNGQLQGAQGISHFKGYEPSWIDENDEVKPGNQYEGDTLIYYELLGNKPAVKQTKTTTSYYGQNISPDELLRVETSTLTYNNKLQSYTTADGKEFFKVQVVDTQEETVVTDPLRDPEGSHITVKNIGTNYTYDNRGNLSNVIGSGTGRGWDYSDTKGWYFPHTSTITVNYAVKLGKPLRTYYQEDKNPL